MTSRNIQRGSAVTQAIKERINIVDIVRRYVDLKRIGNRWMAPCPFHQELKPSFSVNEEEGFFYCFGCQAAGDLFDFYSRVNGIDFRDALAQLAEEAGISLANTTLDPGAQQRKSIKRLALRGHDLAREHYKQNLKSSEAAPCREYIAKRNLDAGIVERFELGWSLDSWDALTNTLLRSGFSKEQGEECGLLIKGQRGNIYDRFRSRLMFPIKNMSGQTIAFGGRIIDDSDAAKYINSSDNPVYKKGDNLYGVFQARRAISVKKTVLLTEGYMDVLTLHQFGYENSCGVLGTALTPEQVKRLGGLAPMLELVFDGDNAGRKAALRSCGLILTKGLNCRVILLPEGEDIDSLLKGQGRECFDTLREKAASGLDFCIKTLNNTFAPVQVTDWVKDFLSNFEVQEMLPRFVAELSRGLGMDPAFLEKFSGSKKKSVSTFLKDSSHKRSADIDTERGFAKTSTGVPGSNPAQGRVSMHGRQPMASLGTAPDPDRSFLAFAIRHPQFRCELQSKGLSFALSQPWSVQLWKKMLDSNPESDSEFLSRLDAEEKLFWIKTKSVLAPPPDLNKDRMELEQVCMSIKRVIDAKSFQSHHEALDHLRGDDYENELLQALTNKNKGKQQGGVNNE